MNKLKDLFSRGGKVEDPDDYVPLFDGSDDDPSQEMSSESWGSIFLTWIKGGFMLLLSGLVFVGILYSFLAAFLIMWVPVGSEASYLDRENVIRNTWSETGGVPPVGDTALVSLTNFKSETKWWDYAIYGWTNIPNSAEVEILSSDRDKVRIETVSSPDSESGYAGQVTITTVEGSPTFSDFRGSFVYGFDAAEKPQTDNIQLDGELLVECVRGDCDPGSVFIISADQIFGEINRK